MWISETVTSKGFLCWPPTDILKGNRVRHKPQVLVGFIDQVKISVECVQTPMESTPRGGLSLCLIACVVLLLFLSIFPFPIFCSWKGERTKREVCCLRPMACLRTPAERRKKPSSSLQDSRGSCCCCLISRGPLTLMPKPPILHHDPVDLLWRYGIEAWEKTGRLFRRTWVFGPHPRHFCKPLMNYTQFSSY